MDYEEKNPDWPSLLGAIALIVFLVGGGIWWVLRGNEAPVLVSESSEEKRELQSEKTAEPLSLGEEKDLAEAAVVTAKPLELANHLGELFTKGKIDSLKPFFEDQAASEDVMKRIQALGARGALQLERVREVGELEINQRKRFAIELKGSDEPVYLDLAKQGSGGWAIEAAKVPTVPTDSLVGLESEHEELRGAQLEQVPSAVQPKTILGDDALLTVDRFLQAALVQNFQKAKSYVKAESVSDAKIAAMCILFEEGNYRLNESKPLRTLYDREQVAGFLVNVLAGKSQERAQFGINTERNEQGDWRILEINLDSLLADYATRVAGGDVYYTPLVVSPQGGETLVLFFDFDEEGLASRTERQLGIVAEILRTDESKSLTISGHADALGSEDYNQALSRGRAEAVRAFLAESGVKDSQLKVVAEGETRPRRPNETLAGEDNPQGRRANRRTEIYLDF